MRLAQGRAIAFGRQSAVIPAEAGIQGFKALKTSKLESCLIGAIRSHIRPLDSRFRGNDGFRDAAGFELISECPTDKSPRK